MSIATVNDYRVKQLNDDNGWGVYAYDGVGKDGIGHERLILQADNQKQAQKALDDYLESMEARAQDENERPVSDTSLISRISHDIISTLTGEQIELLYYDWKMWARPNQMPPKEDFVTWMFMAGRGAGKTRSASEYVNEQSTYSIKQKPLRMIFVGRTAGDIRDLMVLGESGVVSCSPPWNPAVYHPSKRLVRWPNTGAQALLYSADQPEGLRGQQSVVGWFDELGAWQFQQEAYNQAVFGNRLTYYGKGGKVITARRVITTTPRPTPTIREILEDPDTLVTRSTTMENSENLDKRWMQNVLKMYEGTSLGRQELMGELLSEIEGALWSRSTLEKFRVKEIPIILEEIGIGVDPPSGDLSTSECGIIVGGRGTNGHFYVLDDRSISGKPDKWTKAVISAYKEFAADKIFVETNQGGEMAIKVIQDAAKHSLNEKPYIKPINAKEKKTTRAQQPALLYEQGRGHHLGVFAKLEDQMTTYTGKGQKSPDRMDALVHLCRELMFQNNKIDTEHKIIQLKTRW